MSLYAITDIETTGGNVEGERITEIAIVLFDGKKVVDRFHSLINPEKPIPYFITKLTGINDQMVSNSPKFFQVAKQIHEFTKDAIFVAHNVAFDYNFIRREFQSLGFDYGRDVLCTVNLSRKLLPSEPSYSLGKLCSSLGIDLDNHHRALSDTLATVELFKLLLSKKNALEVIQNRMKGIILHSELSKDSLLSIPKSTGVYYFFDEQDKIIYVGKSKNIYKRVFSHLYSNKSKKAIEMKSKIAKVSFELCGSELVALLKESNDIKKHKPVYNRAQKTTKYPVGLYVSYDLNGYLRLKLDKKVKDALPILYFNSFESAKSRLFSLCEEYELCPKLCSLYPESATCFHYQIKVCKGACEGEELATRYNQKVNRLISFLTFEGQNFYILDSGRKGSEFSVVSVQNGEYVGFGFIDNSKELSPEKLSKCIEPYSNNKDVHQIIKSYLSSNDSRQTVQY